MKTYSIVYDDDTSTRVELYATREEAERKFIENVAQYLDARDQSRFHKVAEQLRGEKDHAATVDLADTTWADLCEKFGVVDTMYVQELTVPGTEDPAEGEPELHLLMVLSTGHIELAGVGFLPVALGDDGLPLFRDATLNEQEIPGCVVTSYIGGWHFVLCDEDQDQEWPNPSLQAVVNYARERGATHLRLDRDGPVVAGLPTYNW